MVDAVNEIIKKLTPRYDEDYIDRINYSWTPAILFSVILLAGTKQYAGEPIQCWMGAEYPDNWEKYIETYCKFFFKKMPKSTSMEIDL